jgi:prepilin-type N-terminal cleavage/methylation domain-containing protein/prepilin-type processing-associated H-X9-DG protein
MADAREHSGITLLELIICIAIIAILVALTLPTICRGERSPTFACVSNQRQVLIAAILYRNDQNDSFPNLDTASGNDGPITLSFLTNYAANRTNAFMCPFVVRQRERERPWYRERFVPTLDANFFRSNGNDYAYYDGVPTNSSSNGLIADRLAWTNRSGINLGAGSHFHGRINVGFADGHCETVKADSVVGAHYTPAWSVLQDPIRR